MQPNYYRVIKKATPFSGLDMISHAYGQIAGVEVVGFYLWLITEANAQAFNSEIRTPISRLQNAFNTTGTKNVNVPDWIYKTIGKLESLGLVRTFFSQEKSEMTFWIVEPLGWKEFNQKKHFKEKLIESMGKLEYDRSCLSFEQIDNIQFDNALEITANFEANFTSKQDCLSFSFDFEAFHKQLVKQNLFVSFNQKTKAVINGYFEKYQITLEGILECVIPSVVNDEVDLELLQKLLEQLVKNNTAPIVDTVINDRNFFYDNQNLATETKDAISRCHLEYNAEKYLFLLYGKVENEQLDLIRRLRQEFGIADKVINLIVDFSFWKNNSMWREQYILKIAESVERYRSHNNYQATLDNFIRASSLAKKQRTKTKIEKSEPETSAAPVNETDDVNYFLNRIKAINKKNRENGKHKR